MVVENADELGGGVTTLLMLLEVELASLDDDEAARLLDATAKELDAATAADELEAASELEAKDLVERV